MPFYHIRRWALTLIALIVLSAVMAGCGPNASPDPSIGTPAPTSPGNYGGY